MHDYEILSLAFYLLLDQAIRFPFFLFSFVIRPWELASLNGSTIHDTTQAAHWT